MIERVWVESHVHLRHRGQRSCLCGWLTDKSQRTVVVPDSEVTCVKCVRYLPVKVVKRTT